MLKLLFVFFLLHVSIAYSQVEEARKRVETLCSPEFHGRGYVNGGDSIAAEYLASEFNKLGIKPVKKSYFQAFQFWVNSFPGQMNMTVEGEPLQPGLDFIVDPSSPTCDKSYEVVKLDSITFYSPVELEKRLRNLQYSLSPMFLFDFSGLEGDTVRKLKQMAEQFSVYGPIAVQSDDKFTWSVSSHQLRNPLVNVTSGSLKDGDRVKFDIDANLSVHEARNVIARIPGRRPWSKKILFTAHYDHLGRMGKNIYFPGANDNASGTAMLFTMAEYFKDKKPKHELIFIAFAGEEAGLLGSEYFVVNPLIKLKKIDFLINLDIMGSGEDGVTVVNATKHPEEFKELQRINSEKGLLPTVKERGPAANSDHYWFTEKGVPAFFVYTMGPNKHYHDVHDRYEELSFAAYNAITTLIIEFTETRF
jgi:aminopeptidase YwaD